MPRADAHQNEYVPKCAERLAWLTGFTGSAGFAVVLEKEAAIFVDGRYVIQVRGEIDAKLFKPLDIAEMTPAVWLGEHAKEGARIGYDPWVHASAQIERFTKTLAEKKIELVPLDINPIDALWTDRPARAERRGRRLHPARYAGESAGAKIKKLRAALKDADARADVRSACDLLGLQHSRRRCRAYADRAVLRAASERRRAGALYRRREARADDARGASKNFST